jgi:uncharacterized protein
MRQFWQKEVHYRRSPRGTQSHFPRYHARVCRMTTMTDTSTELDAVAFRRLLQHLNERRADVQNIDLMILAGFCRNCLADWYREAAEARGIAMDRDAARERIYGEPFAQWKEKHQGEATPEQLAAFAAARGKHG